MEILPTIFAVVLVIITVVLSVVGIQIIFVLNELRRTLHRVNDVLDSAEQKMNMMLQPLQNLGGLANGLSSGLKVFESFVGWLNRDRD